MMRVFVCESMAAFPHPLNGTGAAEQVIDPAEDYLKLVKSIYDFPALQRLLQRPDFSFLFDGMHGVAGPYAQRIFVQVPCLASASPPPGPPSS